MRVSLAKHGGDKLSSSQSVERRLPHELWLKIMCRIPGIQLALVRLVSRAWRAHADDPLLWRSLCWKAGVDTSRYIVSRLGDEEEEDGCPSLRIDWPGTFAAHIIRERNRARRFWASHHENAVSGISPIAMDPALRRVAVLVPPTPCGQCIADKAAWADLGLGFDDVDTPVPWLLAAASPSQSSLASSSGTAASPRSASFSGASHIMHTLTSGCELAAGMKDFVPRFRVVDHHEWASSTCSRENAVVVGSLGSVGSGGGGGGRSRSGSFASIVSLESVLSLSPPHAMLGGFSQLTRAMERIRVGGAGDVFSRFEN
ncbi:hypothetical protein HKX48_003415 [Thoreauomyces humboldtii]|nr:hypothetical protein HKX48_003415 [Thoreauomyces humboldtii]